MKYLCLVYTQARYLPDQLPPDEAGALTRECLAYAASLHERGCVLASQALQSTQTATTVRVRNGQVSVTDGPFAETQEQLAGFYLIETHDLDEALRIAAKIPPARYGSVEVRPTRELDVHGAAPPASTQATP